MLTKTAVLLILTGLAMAQTPDEGLLRQAEREWNQAIMRQDAAVAKRFLADDYVLVGVRSTGSSTVEQNAWLEGLAAMRVYSYHSEVTRVRVYGDSAVVSVKGSWHVQFRGQEIDENFFITDVWTKTPAGWKVVLRHSSPYPK